jgi:hypothetical protein
MVAFLIWPVLILLSLLKTRAGLTVPNTVTAGAARLTTPQLRLDPLGRESADQMLTALLGDDVALEPRAGAHRLVPTCAIG